MIKVDISNVWGQLALPDLLALEKEVSFRTQNPDGRHRRGK